MASILLVAAVCLSLVETVFAQGNRGRGSRGWGRRRHYEMPERDIFPSSTFTFCRLHYAGDGGWGGRGGSWRTDFPDSDINFSIRLSELTSIDVNRDQDGRIKHVIVDLLEDDLFNYPFLYALEVAGMRLSDEEAERLRTYLLRGGFLLVDDFWGSQAWDNFEYEISRVFPPEEYPLIDIPLDHDIFHIVFDIDEVPQIPGIGFWYSTGGQTSEQYADSSVPSLRGIFDQKGRLMLVVLHNSDLGDGWEEEAQNPVYFREFSAKKAYPLGINIVVYAMTH